MAPDFVRTKWIANIRRSRLAPVAWVAALALAGCGGSGGSPTRTMSAPATIRLSSPAFSAGGAIPKRYACPRNISPPLRWSGLPKGTRELALEMIDIDAASGPFVHWTLAGIRPTTRALTAGESVPPGAAAGRNSFGRIGYGGPCPPPGKPHRYVITLIALSGRSRLRPGFSGGALPSSRAVARGELTGTYGR